MSNHTKKIVIIAGPNEAGKTTFAREFLPNEAGCWQLFDNGTESLLLLEEGEKP
jgi:predicted ABC-type ATPase